MSDDKDAQAIEARALNVGKWANLFMAAAGIVGSFASRSDALMVDGLYSMVNFASAIVAARIGVSIARPASRRQPWGYDYDETIYVTFRSMVLIGILVFAIFVNSSKIIAFASGAELPELRFGPIAVYAIAMVIICAGLAINYRRAFVRSGKNSEILRTETRASLIDGALSAGSGAALLSLPFLKGTPLEPYLPIGDAVVVLVLVLAILWQPLSTFLKSLADLSGISAPAPVVADASRAARDLAKTDGFRFLRAAVQKAGRSHMIAVYVDPLKPVSAAEVDDFSTRLSATLHDKLGKHRLVTIVTERKEFEPDG